MDLETIFQPSAAFLANLDASEPGDLFIKYSLYPPLTSYPNQSKENWKLMMEMTLLDVVRSTANNIEDYYQVPHYGKSDKFNMEWMNIFLINTTYNAYDHSPTTTPFAVALYISPQGMATGFYDGGDFYKDPQIKDIFAKKLPIKSSPAEKRNIGHSGSKYGIADIQDGTDFLEIDTDQGVLYCGLKRERLFKPR